MDDHFSHGWKIKPMDEPTDEAAPEGPTIHRVPINPAQAKLFQALESGITQLGAKREAGLLMVLAGAGHDTGVFTLQGFDFDEGVVIVELPVPAPKD